MVSDTGNDMLGPAAQRVSGRELRLEGVGIGSMILGAAALVVFFIPGLEESAWMLAVPAVMLGAIDMALKVARRRYAIIGMMLGVIAFSWSFAMMLFGSAR